MLDKSAIKSGKSFKSRLISLILPVFIQTLSLNCLAASAFDGIWAITNTKSPNFYYSIIIKDGQIVVINLAAATASQKVINGTLFGKLDLPNGTGIQPTAPFTVRVDPIVGNEYTNTWYFNFTSEDTGTVSSPPSLNSEVLPPFTIKKIF